MEGSGVRSWKASFMGMRRVLAGAFCVAEGAGGGFFGKGMGIAIDVFIFSIRRLLVSSNADFSMLVFGSAEDADEIADDTLPGVFELIRLRIICVAIENWGM